MRTPHKHAAIIKAWADGAEIEYRQVPAHGWQTVSTPGWSADGQYRVKPTARTVTILGGIATTEDGTQVDLNVLQKHLYDSHRTGLNMKNISFQQGLRHLTGKVWVDGELIDA